MDTATFTEHTLLPDFIEDFKRVIVVFPRDLTSDEQARVKDILSFWNRVDLRGNNDNFAVTSGPDRVVADVNSTETYSDDLYKHADLFSNLIKYFVEGTPVRKSNRSGPNTAGTRLVDGLGIAPVSVTAIALDGEEVQSTRMEDLTAPLRRYLESKLSAKDLSTALYLAEVAAKAASSVGACKVNVGASTQVGSDEAELLKQRIEDALNVASSYGGIDGGHHKMWTIDQMVRHLTGCPVVTREAQDYHGNSYSYEDLEESQEYKDWVVKQCAGEDGPNTYDWDTGIAP